MKTIPYLNEDFNKSMLNEVFAYFIRNNEGVNKKLEIVDAAVKAYMDCRGKQCYYDNLREIERKHKNFIFDLNFYYKARAVLPVIFDIDIKECKSLLMQTMKKARLALLLKRNNWVYDKRLTETDAEKLIDDRASRLERKEMKNYFDELSVMLHKKNPENDEEYINAMNVIENTPDSAFDQGLLKEEYYDAVNYVNRADNRYKILQMKVKLNNDYWQEIKDYQSDLILFEDNLILAPSLFEENNLGFDISKLKIRDEFAKAFVKYFGENATVLDMDKWQYDIYKQIGCRVNHCLDLVDKDGNVQLTIDQFLRNEESE